MENEIKNQNESIWKSPIFYAALIAAIISLVGIILQYSFRQEDKKLAFQAEIMKERKQALLQALHVIDCVYANSNWLAANPKFRHKPHPWQIQDAWDATNKMMIYCQDPQTTITTFFRAIGIHNPSLERPKEYSAGGIQEFRVQAARELNLPIVQFDDSVHLWISQLPGAQ